MEFNIYVPSYKAKVFAWIWRNAPEDVFAVIDDDIEKFMYRLDDLKDITDPVQVTSKIERLAQMLVDLNLGYLASPLDSNVKFYDRPFKFVGMSTPGNWNLQMAI